jgi:hypothetical protein
MYIGDLVSAITQFVTLATVIFVFFNLWYRFGKLERQAAHRQEDIEIIFKSLRGCLEGTIENGANGSVKVALSDLNDYIAKKASGQAK